jgi:hypothetical protein
MTWIFQVSMTRIFQVSMTWLKERRAVFEINRSAHGPFIYQTLSYQHPSPHFPSLFSTMNPSTGTHMIAASRTRTRSVANRSMVAGFVQYMTTDVDNAPSFIRVVRESGGAAMRISRIDNGDSGAWWHMYARGDGASVTMSTDNPWEEVSLLLGHVYREFPDLEIKIVFADFDEGRAGVYTREKCEDAPFMVGMAPNPYWTEHPEGKRLDKHFDIMRTMRLWLAARPPPTSTNGLVVGQSYTEEHIRSLFPDATFINDDSDDSPPDSSRVPCTPDELAKMLQHII